MTWLCLKCYQRGAKVPAESVCEGVALCASCADECNQRAYEQVYRPR